MKRVISLYLPTWPTDRLFRTRAAAAPREDQRRRPVILVGADGRSKVVYAANAAARRAGAHAGMPVTQAQALIPDLEASIADADGDRRDLEKLGLWAVRRYSPAVAVDGADGLVMDAGGVAHLFGGEAELLADLTQRLGSVGIAARASIAPTWGAAHAAARYFKPKTNVITQEMLVPALLPLPTSALRLEAGTVSELRRLGFDAIGELANAPRAPLALRFGKSILQRLDQIFGRVAEPFTPLAPPELPRVTRSFAEPISAPETLHRYTERLAVDLANLLEGRVLGATQLDLIFFRIDSRIEAIRTGFVQPTRVVRRLYRALKDRIETIDPGPGVERMMLTASRTDTLPYRPGSALGEQPEKDIGELIDTLTHRVGEERLYRLAACESDIPERSQIRIPPLAAGTKLRWAIDWPRPSRLFTHPEPVETLALLPDHPPVQFTWQGVRRRIRRADGPERIFGEWIRSSAEAMAVRDYFVVEDEAGERFWLFRAGDGEDPATGSQQWFIHGVFG